MSSLVLFGSEKPPKDWRDAVDWPQRGRDSEREIFRLHYLLSQQLAKCCIEFHHFGELFEWASFPLWGEQNPALNDILASASLDIAGARYDLYDILKSFNPHEAARLERLEQAGYLKADIPCLRDVKSFMQSVPKIKEIHKELAHRIYRCLPELITFGILFKQYDMAILEECIIEREYTESSYFKSSSKVEDMRDLTPSLEREHYSNLDLIAKFCKILQLVGHSDLYEQVAPDIMAARDLTQEQLTRWIEQIT